MSSQVMKRTLVQPSSRAKLSQIPILKSQLRKKRKEKTDRRRVLTQKDLNPLRISMSLSIEDARAVACE